MNVMKLIQVILVSLIHLINKELLNMQISLKILKNSLKILYKKKKTVQFQNSKIKKMNMFILGMYVQILRKIKKKSKYLYVILTQIQSLLNLLKKCPMMFQMTKNGIYQYSQMEKNKQECSLPKNKVYMMIKLKKFLHMPLLNHQITLNVELKLMNQN